MPFARLSAALAVCIGCAFASSSPAGQTGIVLLHGKQDTAPYALEPVAQALRGAGHAVETPEMPWSLVRDFDAPHDAALAELGGLVERLRRQGVDKVIIGGHGLGGNTALAFAASGARVDGLLLIAPAHTPEVDQFAAPVADSVARARRLIADGRAGERGIFLDTNHRNTRPLSTSAAIYWSYFDPDGTAAMSRSARRMTHALPVLWVYGTRDVLRGAGAALFYDALPAHPRSSRVSLVALLVSTPRAAVDDITQWVRSLDKIERNSGR